jgi:N-methylhydantoinase B
MTIDPVTLAILKGRLEQIADEMDATLFRSAFNPIIAEAHDASHGIYDAKTGDTLVQGKSGLPIFVGVMAFAVKAVIDKAAKQGGVHEGDVWIFNDPYDGGTHLSDFRLVKPVFRNGEVFCYLASVGHWHDVGGNVPGNYNPAATECFQEGMLIPPVKLYDRGEFRQDIVDILSSNSRLPLSLYGDLNGQINALAARREAHERAARRIWRRQGCRMHGRTHGARRADDAGADFRACPRERSRRKISSTMTASMTSR